MEKQIRLPEEYLQHMKSLLGEKEYLDYIKSFDSKRYQGLRANGIKITPKRLKELAPWELEKIPWIPNGFYYGEDAKPARKSLLLCRLILPSGAERHDACVHPSHSSR